MQNNDPNSDSARLRRLVGAVAEAINLAGELINRLPGDEEGEGNEWQRRASDLAAHLEGALFEVDGGPAEPDEQIGATGPEQRQVVRSSELLGADLIQAERLRQIEAEGWSAAHDDEHRRYQMARAAASYVLSTLDKYGAVDGQTNRLVMAAAMNALWPWENEWWKPDADPVRNLVKAGALIAAEIDRLNRERRKAPNHVLDDSPKK